MKIGFVIVGYNQYEELKWTLHRMRHHWQRLQDSPVSVVLSGDPDCQFDGSGENIIEHVDDIVEYTVYDMYKYFIWDTYPIRPGIGRKHFRAPANNWVAKTGSEAIFRNYKVGMHNLREIADDIDVVVITESNILFFEEGSIYNVAKKLVRDAGKVGSIQTVYIDDKNGSWWIGKGQEVLPQVMLFDWDFCKRTNFLFEYENTRPECMEKSLSDNLKRALAADNKNFQDYMHIGPQREQWGVHNTLEWISFAHLDRRPGATDDNPAFKWSSREEQIEFERQILHNNGITCLELPCS